MTSVVTCITIAFEVAKSCLLNLDIAGGGGMRGALHHDKEGNAGTMGGASSCCVTKTHQGGYFVGGHCGNEKKIGQHWLEMSGLTWCEC